MEIPTHKNRTGKIEKWNGRPSYPLMGLGFLLKMLVHSLSQNDPTDKIVWSVGIFITGIVASIVYYFWKYKQEPVKNETTLLTKLVEQTE